MSDFSGTFPTSPIPPRGKCCDNLQMPFSSPILPHIAGLFVSRGYGIHPQRTLDLYELIFVRKGTLGIFEADRTFEVHAGQALLLLPGIEHGGTLPYKDDLSFYWLHFTVDAEIGDENLIKDIPQMTALAEPDRMESLLRRYISDQESNRLQPFNGTLLILQMLAEICTNPAPTQPANMAGADLVERAKQFIIANFHKTISTADVADAMGCNPDYLGRIFRKHVGQTITTFIQREQIREAQALLAESPINIEETARQCGFSDPGYFRRVFRKLTGMSPRDFRKRYSRMHVISH